VTQGGHVEVFVASNHDSAGDSLWIVLSRKEVQCRYSEGGGVRNNQGGECGFEFLDEHQKRGGGARRSCSFYLGGRGAHCLFIKDANSEKGRDVFPSQVCK